MTTIHVRAIVTEDRKLTVTLPDDAPIGELDIEVKIKPHVVNGAVRAKPSKKAPYSEPGLLEWSRENAGHYGDEMRSDDVEGFTGRRY